METTEATREGVEGTIEQGNKDVTLEGKGTELTPEDKPSLELEVKRSRDDVMSDIVANRQKQLADEAGEVAPEPAVVEPEEPESKPEPIEPETVEVKVDGEIRKVTPQEIAEYQKNVAADKRLQEVHEARIRLQAREEEIKRREEALKQAPPAATQTPEPAEADLDELADQLIDGTFSEDKGTVKKVLKTLVSKQPQVAPQPAQPAVSVADIDARIAAREAEAAQKKAAAERQKAVNRFSKEYPELNANAALRNTVDQQTVIERQKDPHASDWEIIDRSAKHVKADIQSALGIEGTPEVDPSTQKRIDRKKSMGTPVVPTASAKAPASNSQQQQKLTPFQEIQQARGQG